MQRSRRQLSVPLDDEGVEPQVELREQILSSMDEGVLLLEPGGEVAYANRAAERLLGPGPRIPQELVQEGTADTTVYFPFRRELRSTATRLDEGRLLIVVRDITDAKRVEAMRRDFVADASHELKTPVAGILAAAETLEASARDDPAIVPRFAESLLADAHRLSRLVKDLLDLARLDRPEIQDSGRVDLSEVCRGEAERLRVAAKNKGLDLALEIEGDVEVLGAPDDIALAVGNLLDNAIRYTEHGSVSIRVRSDEEFGMAEISDTGVGIPERELNRIFERFYRVDRARSRETGGTGLGLSIVRHVSERSSGEVKAESVLGRGSTFTLKIPLA